MNKTIYFKGLQFAYEVHNSNMAKTCFLSHGLGDGISAFENLVPLLMQKGYKVVVYDLLGCGKNNDFGTPFEDNLNILNSLVNTEGTNYNIFVGHSLGGLVTLLTILEYNLDYQKIITIEPSITQVDYDFFKFVQEIPDGIGYDEYSKGNGLDSGYLLTYRKNIGTANSVTMKHNIKTVYENFTQFQSKIFNSSLIFDYCYGSLSTETEKRAELSKYKNINVLCFENANHWVHIDAEIAFIDYISKTL